MRRHYIQLAAILIATLLIFASCTTTKAEPQKQNHEEEPHVLLVQDPIPAELEEEYPIAPYSGVRGNK